MLSHEVIDGTINRQISQDGISISQHQDGITNNKSSVMCHHDIAEASENTSINLFNREIGGSNTSGLCLQLQDSTNNTTNHRLQEDDIEVLPDLT